MPNDSALTISNYCTNHFTWSTTGWRRPIGCLKLHVIFCKRATYSRALLRKMTYKGNASYDSTPPCTGYRISVSLLQSQTLIDDLVLYVSFATFRWKETNEIEIGVWDWRTLQVQWAVHTFSIQLTLEWLYSWLLELAIPVAFRADYSAFRLYSAR